VTPERFDLVVVGAGPAGEKAGAQAAYFGKHVAIVDRRDDPGGSAASKTGVPTKTLREAALYLTGFRRRDLYGAGMDLGPETVLEAHAQRAELPAHQGAAALRDAAPQPAALAAHEGDGEVLLDGRGGQGEADEGHRHS